MNDDDDAEEFDIFLFHSAAAAFIEIDREREVRKETLLVGFYGDIRYMYASLLKRRKTTTHTHTHQPL